MELRCYISKSSPHIQEVREKSLNNPSKKVEIIGIYYLYLVKVTYMQSSPHAINTSGSTSGESNSVRPT